MEGKERGREADPPDGQGVGLICRELTHEACPARQLDLCIRLPES